MNFSTLEDVNSVQFDNQGFWWYEIDTRELPDGDITDLKWDFLCINRTYNADLNTNDYKIYVDNSLWTFGGLVEYVGSERSYIEIRDHENYLECREHLEYQYDYLKIYIYMGHQWIHLSLRGMLVDDNISLDLKQLNSEQTIQYSTKPNERESVVVSLSKGLNEIIVYDSSMGYLLVKLLKTDFQFDCSQQLIVGEVNTVCLGTHSDYKPNGDLVGEYTTNLSVQYGDKTLPVVWNSALNDYTFDLDLTNIQSEGKIRFKVIVETNDVLNRSETDVALDCKFETIDTLAKLTNLFRIGGTGRLSSDLTLTNDLTLSKNVNLIGNDCSIDMASHKLVIPSDLTFKAQSVGFSNGINTLQQEPNSTVELTDCSFTGCTGFGSVIDCQVDIASLDETDDFNTKLTNCNIVDCDMAILHGGNLEVNGCSVIGKISNKNYPYFLYQTDGNATILNSEFSLTDETVYDYDLEFNTCIFTCGETATINGYSHTELQQNNRSAFLETQRNTSKIDVQYYYSLIEANVHLQSSKGYCHSVSNVDFVYKTNITLTRGE